jgi:hypothetical protein
MRSPRLQGDRSISKFQAETAADTEKQLVDVNMPVPNKFTAEFDPLDFLARLALGLFCAARTPSS